MPPVQRSKPLWLQVHDYFADLIARGELKPGDSLPSMEVISREHGVSKQTAVRAVGLLGTGRLVTTTRDGTVVAPQRLVPGAPMFPTAHRVAVTPGDRFVQLRPEWEYIRPILGLEEVPRHRITTVLRREEVWHDADGKPFLLLVRWWPSRFAERVPELTGDAPITAPGGTVALIRAGTGEVAVTGEMELETRQILNDGREGRLLNLAPRSYVLAETYTLFAAPGKDGSDEAREHGRALEYGEAVVIPNRVTRNEFTL
jgi:DNA-binding GntR family transcriptional regulator